MENIKSIDEELSSFCEQWKEELQQQVSVSSSPSDTRPSPSSQPQPAADVNKDLENKAKTLYLTGVSLEKKRRTHEAVGYYRQAIQLVPDIESRISDFNVEQIVPMPESNHEDLLYDEEYIYDDEDEDPNNIGYTTNISNDLLDVVKDFSRFSIKGICEPEFPTMSTHISALPAEVITYIFKWVVSTSLDLRSLEQLALVCHGFYALARDPEMWRLVCVRIWGINLGSAVIWSDCWRQMFLERAHLLYDGVYISRITYFRPNEPIFQQSYSLYQVIVYYRYLRFFTDGSVVFETTHEEPHCAISHFSVNDRTQANVASGNFKLVGNKVIVVVQKPDVAGTTVIRKGSRRHASPVPETRFFHLELELQHTRKKRNNRLTWLQFSCQTFHRSTGQTTVSELDITNKFPPFYFSRVRSYQRPSCAPL